MVAQDIIDPKDIDTSFDMIGGYEIEKKELKVLYMLKYSYIVYCYFTNKKA